MNIKYYFGGFARYATFDGRASRAEFWNFFFFHLFVSLLTPYIDQMFETYSPDGNYGIFNIGYRLIAFLPSLALVSDACMTVGKVELITLFLSGI